MALHAGNLNFLDAIKGLFVIFTISLKSNFFIIKTPLKSNHNFGKVFSNFVDISLALRSGDLDEY